MSNSAMQKWFADPNVPASEKAKAQAAMVHQKFFKTTSEESASGYKAVYTSDTGKDLVIKVVGNGLTYDGAGTVTNGFVTSLVYEDIDGKGIETVTGIGSINAVAFYNAIINDNTFSPTGRYQFLVSLLDDNTTVSGSDGDDGIEVGAGNDTVVAGAGDDAVYKWKSGTLNFNGGVGSDTIVFQAATGIINPSGKTHQLVVNLGAGTGTNPFGGAAVTFANIENVIGTDLADRLTGSAADNIFGDGIFDIGADIINALGGNDRVNLAEGAFGNPGGVRAEGGAGLDTLAVNLGLFASSGPTSHRLDLTNQANNTGVFKNDVLTNFEVFVHGSGFFGPNGHAFTFIDTDGGHTAEAMVSTNNLTMNGGDDTVLVNANFPVPSNYRITADGGAGTDTLQFEVNSSATDNKLDLTNQANNSGIFAGSTFNGFETFRHVEDGDNFSDSQKFTFVGTAAGETVAGALGIDIIDTGAGNDRLGGGLGSGFGSDMLTGGKGKDTFVLDAKLGFGFANVAEITDFKPKDDTIELDNAIFTALKTGKLKAKHFVIGKKAKDGNDYVIYDKKTGGAFYDADGKGGTAAVQFAELDRKLDVTKSDFLVV